MEIHIKNLQKSFGKKRAVDIPAFNVRQGEILGLVGNNGAGKTTLFRLMLDLLKADQGELSLSFDNHDDILSQYTIQGHQQEKAPEDWKRHTGAYIDEGFLIDFLTPEEYFEFIGKVCDMTKGQVEARMGDFEQFMHGEIVGQKKLIRDLSAGNKQKVGIVAALFNRPQLVVLDEPFNFLDPSSQNILKRLLQDYRSTDNATILISSHNLQHTVDISTRIALLENGAIIKDMPNTDGCAEKELESYFEI